MSNYNENRRKRKLLLIHKISRLRSLGKEWKEIRKILDISYTEIKYLMETKQKIWTGKKNKLSRDSKIRVCHNF